MLLYSAILFSLSLGLRAITSGVVCRFLGGDISWPRTLGVALGAAVPALLVGIGVGNQSHVSVLLGYLVLDRLLLAGVFLFIGGRSLPRSLGLTGAQLFTEMSCLVLMFCAIVGLIVAFH